MRRSRKAGECGSRLATPSEFQTEAALQRPACKFGRRLRSFLLLLTSQLYHRSFVQINYNIVKMSPIFVNYSTGSLANRQGSNATQKSAGGIPPARNKRCFFSNVFIQLPFCCCNAKCHSLLLPQTLPRADRLSMIIHPSGHMFAALSAHW